MNKIFQSQQKFFKLGYTRSVTYRETMLVALKNTLKEHEKELSEALYKDLGKHPKESYTTEFFMIYKSLNNTLKNLSSWTKDKRVKTPLLLKPATSYKRSIPYGNALIMGAYNYPLLLTMDPLIGAIAAGNTIMLSLSKASRFTNEVLIKMINETFDSNYVYAFETDRTLNQEILDYPFDKIFFTGSKQVGKIVLEKASQNLTSTTLELGGKSPAVILRDANLKNASEYIMYSKVINSGQTCIASDYVIVDHLIADEFIESLKKTFDKFYPSLDDYPKMIDQKAYERIIERIKADENYVVSSLDCNEKNLKIKPVILKASLEEAKTLKSMSDEIFGPILPVIVYEDLNEALRFVNTFDTPLALYIFGKRRAMIDRVLVNVDAGGVSINSTMFHMVNHHLPFGGLRASGLGRYHGKYSFDTFAFEQGVYHKKGLQVQKVIFPPFRK